VHTAQPQKGLFLMAYESNSSEINKLLKKAQREKNDTQRKMHILAMITFIAGGSQA